ncbi:MAG: C1 family peptidase [Crocinitomicaceae bacterium]
MPIRMVEDDPQGGKKKRRVVRRQASSSSSSSGGGMNGGLGKVAGALLPMLMKKPKLLLILAVVGVVLFFLFGKGCDTSAISEKAGGITNFFQRGGEMKKEIYEETEIYEPLADNKKNPLPEKVSLLQYAPKRKNQGKQGSCVAWASAYAARTILESRRTGRRPDQVAFSPSFQYNQIKIDGSNCQGSYIKRAMDNMYGQGAVPYKDFAYDQNSCSKEPSATLKRKANDYKIRGFQRLTEENSSNTAEMLAIKQNLAKGSPVVIGMMVGGTFMSNMMGKDVWIPTQSDYNKSGFGGHAMCVIGYDDFKEGGSFQIMNSWGEKWGKKGVCWVRYSDFKFFNVESYGLYPMGDANAKVETRFKGSFGLELNQGKRNIAMKQVNDFYFETVSRLSSKDKFKVEFTNNIECYTYIFGQETDGSSYVLFPYTPKHSPYCGITGTRLFPRDHSMQPDASGKKDKIAVLITKDPIDYSVINKKISNASGSTYEQKVKNALAGQFETNVRFTGGSGVVNFETSAQKGKGVAFVIGVNK